MKIVELKIKSIFYTSCYYNISVSIIIHYSLWHKDLSEWSASYFIFPSNFLKDILSFLGVHKKWSRKYRGFLSFHVNPALPHIQLPPHEHHAQECTLVTTNEPTLMYRYHPKPIAYMQVLSWYCQFYDFDKCIMTYIHH